MSEAAETGVGLCEADDPTDSQPDGAERRGAERGGVLMQAGPGPSDPGVNCLGDFIFYLYEL